MVYKGRTLIIGASGFLGLHAAKALKLSGREVIGLGPRPVDGWFDRFVEGRSELVEPLKDALIGVENVVYLGGTSRPAIGMARISDEIMREANHVIDVAEICAALGVRRFVFASSGGTVYGHTNGQPAAETFCAQPANTYGLSKLVAEHGLTLVGRRTGLLTISLRISNPYGPGQRVKAGQGFIAAVCERVVHGGSVTIWGDGSTVRDFIYIDDVSASFARAVEPGLPPGVYNIGSGQGMSLLDICHLAEERSGTKLGILFEPGRPVDVPHIVLNLAKAKSALGWLPRISMEEGIDRTLRWWREAPVR